MSRGQGSVIYFFNVKISRKQRTLKKKFTANGKAAKLKPEQKRPANRDGKLAYAGAVVAALRVVAINPAAIDRRLKKDKAALRLKGKSFAKPLDALKSHMR